MKFVYYICDACQAKAMDMMSFNLGGQSDRHYCHSCAVKIGQSITDMVECLQAEQRGKTNCTKLRSPGSSMVEHLADNQKDGGSRPPPATNQNLI